MSEFLEAVPAMPYGEVSKRLDPNVAPVQVISLQFREARSDGSIRNAAKDNLCRNILGRFPGGWGIGERPEWQEARALASWSSDVIATGGSAELKPVVDAVMHHFRRFPPPLGWITEGSEDPIIRDAFDAAWPDA